MAWVIIILPVLLRYFFFSVGPDIPDFRQVTYNWQNWGWERIFAIIDLMRLELMLWRQSQLLIASWISIFSPSSRIPSMLAFWMCTFHSAKFSNYSGGASARTPRRAAKIKFDWCRRFWRRLYQCYGLVKSDPWWSRVKPEVSNHSSCSLTVEKRRKS